MNPNLSLLLIFLMCFTVLDAFRSIPVHKCYCQAGFVWSKRKCVPAETFIPIIVFNPWETSSISSTISRVVDISRVRCRNDQLLLPLREGSFYMLEDGDLFHLFTSLTYKSTDYCIEHIITKDNAVRLDALVCVSPPYVPRCCDKGSVFSGIDLKCAVADNSKFNPPIMKEPTMLQWKSLEGPFVGFPVCYPGEVLHQVALSSDISSGTLLYRPNGVFLQAQSAQVSYLVPPSDYCVGIEEVKNNTFLHSALYCDAPVPLQGPAVNIRHSHRDNQVYLFPLFFFP